MSARAMRWGMVSLALAAAQALAPVQAQDAMYKCYSKGGVVYSQIPCGKPLDAPKPRVNVRYQTPSQDRAKAARRATLSAEARQECSALDTRLQQQEAEFKARGDAATLQDEMPLVRSKKPRCWRSAPRARNRAASPAGNRERRFGSGLSRHGYRDREAFGKRACEGSPSPGRHSRPRRALLGRTVSRRCDPGC